MSIHSIRRSTALLAAFTLAACGGAKEQPADTALPPAPAAGAAGSEQTPDAGGQVVTVEMLTDEQGNNVFRPAQVSARRGTWSATRSSRACTT
jgi:hypothetical protein